MAVEQDHGAENREASDQSEFNYWETVKAGWNAEMYGVHWGSIYGNGSGGYIVPSIDDSGLYRNWSVFLSADADFGKPITQLELQGGGQAEVRCFLVESPSQWHDQSNGECPETNESQFDYHLIIFRLPVVEDASGPQFAAPWHQTYDREVVYSD